MTDEILRLDSPLAKQLGFTSDKFDGYLWLKDGLIIISLIISRDPGKGHFLALLDSIFALGYRIRVPTPSNRMRAILHRRGFEQMVVMDKHFGPVEIYEGWPEDKGEGE